jgi:cellulose synthase operon protein C
MARRQKTLILVLSLVLSVQAQDEPSLFGPVPLAPVPAVAGALILSEESARRALALGFSTTAAAQAERLLANATTAAARDAAGLILATARLEQDDAAAAARILARPGAVRSPAWRLRNGLAAARLGDTQLAQRELDGLQPEEIEVEERAWFYLLQGMVAEATRDSARAGAAYDQALDLANSDWQRARLNLTRERLRLALGEATEKQAAELRQQAERYAGRGVAVDYAIQYAVCLTQLGRREQAVGYLQTQLAGLPESGATSTRDDLWLMMGLIAGSSRTNGRAALEQLVVQGTDNMKQRMALQQLVTSADSFDAREQLRKLATRLLARIPPHPLTEELLIARGELALSDGLHAQSETDARDLLSRFPASALRVQALTQLTATAWELKRFRAAADYAAQAALASTDQGKVASLNLLAGEAAYRAGDFASATQRYEAAAERPPEGIPVADILFQSVMAEIKDQKLDAAGKRLDRLAGDTRMATLQRWQAEWNLARAWQTNRQGPRALARITRLRAEPQAEALPSDLRARFAWLEARLAQDDGRFTEALELVRKLLPKLSTVEAKLAQEISGLAHLITAEALFGQGYTQNAITELQNLRAAYPKEPSAAKAYLMEADIQAATGNLVEAQRLLVEFVDEDPSDPYAPAAIFQAALHAERRGEDSYYQEAYRLLEERLVRKYPQSPWTFSAQQKQGDLLRRLGDFPGAQQFYELLERTNAQHPQILSVQLALADCHRAQAKQDPTHFESALTILERLRDLADAPTDIRAEAGFKLGDMLAERASTNDADAALAIWWPVAETLLLDPARATTLGPNGRYWMGRLLVRMAGVLDKLGRPEEAREIWRLLIDRRLPGMALARSHLEPSDKNTLPAAPANMN